MAHTKQKLTSLVVALMLVGGVNLPRAHAEPDIVGLNPMQKVVANGVSEIETSFSDVFISRPIRESEQLPPKNISNFSFNDASVIDAVKLLLANTGVSLSFRDAGNKNKNVYGSVVSYGLSGTLQEVLDNVADGAGFFYSYRRGVLTIYPEEQFLVKLPPLIDDDVYAGITNTITKLGATDVYLDRQGRSIVFRANRSSSQSIAQYLEQVRTSRHMIVLKDKKATDLSVDLPNITTIKTNATSKEGEVASVVSKLKEHPLMDEKTTITQQPASAVPQIVLPPVVAGSAQDNTTQEEKTTDADPSVQGNIQEDAVLAMRLSDRNLSTTIARWSNDNNYKVEWSSKQQVLVSADAIILAKDFLEAIYFVISKANNNGYTLDVDIDHKDKIIWVK